MGHCTNLRDTCINTGLHLLSLYGVSGARDEQRSVLNVPLRLTRLSVRMILGLISPTDWIWSLGERCPQSPSPLPLLREGVFTVTWSDGVRHYEPLKMNICTNQNSKYEDRGFNAMPYFQKACTAFVTPPVFERVARSSTHRQTAGPFWPLVHRRDGYLNCCPIWGAIKNHLGLYKGAHRPLQNVLWRRWDENVFGFPEEVRKGSSLHVFYDFECYISIFCLLVWRHLKDES